MNDIIRKIKSGRPMLLVVTEPEGEGRKIHGLIVHLKCAGLAMPHFETRQKATIRVQAAATRPNLTKILQKAFSPRELTIQLQGA